MAAGAGLAALLNESDHNAAKALCTNSTSFSCYIGLIRLSWLPNTKCSATSATNCNNDIACKCGYTWTGYNNSVSYTKWAAGRPAFFSANCVALQILHDWQDVQCGAAFPAICEGKVTQFVSTLPARSYLHNRSSPPEAIPDPTALTLASTTRSSSTPTALAQPTGPTTALP
jgi:hypothetical protein